VWNAAGAVVWAALYTTASYKAGGFLERSSGTINVVLGVLAVVVIVTSLVVIRRRTDSLADKAELAYPGPLDDQLR
jgi:membrane protein DedA with SNARE-associated domain